MTGSQSRAHSAEYRRRLSSADWKRLRAELISEQLGFCARCNRYRLDSLELHHLHYKTLGHETKADLELLCRECHPFADSERFQRMSMERRRRVLAWATAQAVVEYREPDWWLKCSWDDVVEEFYDFIGVG